jgi:hypothetical protein
LRIGPHVSTNVGGREMGNHALRGTLDACAVQCCWPRHWPAACRGHAFHALVNALPATQMSSHNRCSQCEMHATLVHCKTTLFECSQGKLHTPCVAGAGPARQASTDKGHAYVIDFMSSATVELSLQQLSPRDKSQQAHTAPLFDQQSSAECHAHAANTRPYEPRKTTRGSS